MNPRTTGILALVAAILGGFVYFYEIEGEVARKAAEADRERIHPGLEAEMLEAVEFTTEDALAVRFERQDGVWRLTSPVEAAADATALDAIAYAITSLPRKGRVASAPDLDQYGLGEDARVVRFEVGGETQGVRIGRNTPVGGHLYVARLGDDEVAFVESYRLNPLKRALDDLRERRIFDFDSGEVEALRVEWPDREGRAGQIAVAVERDGESGWRLTSPDAGQADEVVVRELLSNLAYLTAADFVDDRGPAVEAALGEPAMDLAWRLAGEDVEHRARIAGVFEGARLFEGPEGRLFTIASERLEDFPRSIVAYRFKTLSAFDVSDARRLVIGFASMEGGENEAEREVVLELGETGWGASDGAVDPDRISDLVRDLAGLHAQDIVADEMGPGELAGLGLSPPRARLRVERSDLAADQNGEADADARASEPEALADLRIGRLDEDRGLFVQRADSPVVYLLSLEEAEALPISGMDFDADFLVDEAEASEEEDEAFESLDSLGSSDEVDPLEGLELP